MFGVNSAGNIFYRAGITEDTPTGTGWVRVPGGLKQIDTYKSEVWGSNSASDVFKLDISCSGWSLHGPRLCFRNFSPCAYYQINLFRSTNPKKKSQNACMPVKITGFNIRLILLLSGPPTLSSWKKHKTGLKRIAAGKLGLWGVDINNRLFKK